MNEKIFLMVGENISTATHIVGFSSKELADRYASYIESSIVREITVDELNVVTDLSWYYVKIKRAKLGVYTDVEISPYKSPDIMTSESLETNVRWIKNARSFVGLIWAKNTVTALSEVMTIVEQWDSEEMDNKNSKDISLK